MQAQCPSLSCPLDKINCYTSLVDGQNTVNEVNHLTSTPRKAWFASHVVRMELKPTLKRELVVKSKHSQALYHWGCFKLCFNNKSVLNGNVYAVRKVFLWKTLSLTTRVATYKWKYLLPLGVQILSFKNSFRFAEDLGSRESHFLFPKITTLWEMEGKTCCLLA